MEKPFSGHDLKEMGLTPPQKEEGLSDRTLEVQLLVVPQTALGSSAQNQVQEV